MNNHPYGTPILPDGAAQDLLRAMTGHAPQEPSDDQIRERELALSYLRADYVACSRNLYELVSSLTR
jgi:hypothetical protein